MLQIIIVFLVFIYLFFCPDDYQVLTVRTWPDLAAGKAKVLESTVSYNHLLCRKSKLSPVRD